MDEKQPLLKNESHTQIDIETGGEKIFLSADKSSIASHYNNI